MDRYRRDAGWKAFSAFLMLGLGIIAFVIWAALSAAHSAEKAELATDLCYPYKIGFTKLAAMTKASGGKLIAIPPAALPTFLANMGKYGSGITGDGAFMAVGPTFTALFVLHGKQLCLARAGAPVDLPTPKPTSEEEKPHYEGEGSL